MNSRESAEQNRTEQNSAWESRTEQNYVCLLQMLWMSLPCLIVLALQTKNQVRYDMRLIPSNVESQCQQGCSFEQILSSTQRE